MEIEQEEALYEFLENAVEPFTLDEITSYVQAATSVQTHGIGEAIANAALFSLSGNSRAKRLSLEISAHLEERKAAFRQDKKYWVSRRNIFEKAEFVITPTRLELLNGILIPGHRCVPFANPIMLPNFYEFFWNGKPVPTTTTEAPPEDLYPYYCIYGEEFAPQYIARDNPQNEEAYNSDPYEDPSEVSIHTLDMRGIYRECSFVPGDRFAVCVTNWKDCHFELRKIAKDEWTAAVLENWTTAAETGFENSFALLGAGVNTEEQIAFAYWYGGKRVRELPAYSLEEFIYEKTDAIDTVPYGIETRFWFAGKEIPDAKFLQNNTVPPDRTFIEELLYKKHIPISEYVVLAYIKDAFFRNEKTIEEVINRIIPPVIHLDKAEWLIITKYVAGRMEDFYPVYSLFLDQSTGPVRQRVAELHTAVVELSAKLEKGEIETAWLPKHTFIVLSQIQGHAASLLEDLVLGDSPPESDIIAMDNSLENMLETYDDIKELINNAMDNFRRSSLTLIHGGDVAGPLLWTIQISISGLDIWRRAIVSHECTMEELHKIIQISMDWKGTLCFRFYLETSDGGKQYLHDTIKLGDIDFHGKKEIIYEYGPKWIIRIIIMSSYQGAEQNIKDATRFTAGTGSAPPEQVEGPRQFGRLLASLETTGREKQFALTELGADFNPNVFDLDKANRSLRDFLSAGSSL